MSEARGSGAHRYRTRWEDKLSAKLSEREAIRCSTKKKQCAVITRKRKCRGASEAEAVKAAAARRAAKNRQENIERNTTENMAVTGNMKATVTKVAAKAAAAAGTITAGWNT